MGENYAILTNNGKLIVIDNNRAGPMATPGYPMAVDPDTLFSYTFKFYHSVEQAENAIEAIMSWNLYGVGPIAKADCKVVKINIAIEMISNSN